MADCITTACNGRRLAFSEPLPLIPRSFIQPKRRDNGYEWDAQGPH